MFGIAAMALAAVTTGCGGNAFCLRAERQDEAVRKVWNEVYARTDEPPKIIWITELPCTNPVNGKPGFHTMAGCREGETVLPSQVKVACDGVATYSGTTLAHELLHALQLRDHVADPLHKTEGFRPVGECVPQPPTNMCGIVDRANQALEALSL